MLTELDSGERVISERLDHVRSAAVVSLATILVSLRYR